MRKNRFLQAYYCIFTKIVDRKNSPRVIFFFAARVLSCFAPAYVQRAKNKLSFFFDS